MNRLNVYLISIFGTELVGFIAGVLTREGTRIYAETVAKPELSPPAVVFPIVWTVLYALMGIGAARIYLAPKCSARTFALQLYAAQLFLNFAWSFIFFTAQAYTLAFLWLLALAMLVDMMFLQFLKLDRWAAVIQFPYQGWLLFAAYLSFVVMIRN